jgi:hypothetical protein
MKKHLTFIIVFLAINSLLFAELTKAQMWAISLTGIMTELNRSNRNSLNASEMDEKGKNIWLEVLRRDWGITTRAELLSTIDGLTDRNNASYYRFFITVNGRYTIQKRVGNTWATAPLSWRDSLSINTGFNVYNTLRVERTDNENSATFRIFINGTLSATFNDSSPINGSKAGLVVSVNVMELEQFPYIPVDVRFYY